jgi:predicted small secreted protein
MKRPIRQLSSLTATALLALLLVGCNTMEGFGQDMSAAGKALSNWSEDVQDEEPVEE